jgi:hypothetical protein
MQLDSPNRAGTDRIGHGLVVVDERSHRAGPAIGIGGEGVRRQGDAGAAAAAGVLVHAEQPPPGHRSHQRIGRVASERPVSPVRSVNHSSGTANRGSAGSRLSSVPMATCSSMRASWAPRQWCTP